MGWIELCGMGCVMKIIRFRRLERKPETRMMTVRMGIPDFLKGHIKTEFEVPVEVDVWEIARNEQELWAKLDGEMAEIIIPAKAWYVRLWRIFFPLKMVEVDCGHVH